MPSRRAYRSVLAVIVVLSAASVGLTSTTTGSGDVGPSASSGVTARSVGTGIPTETLQSRELTIISTQVFRDWANEGDLLVVDSEGNVVYRNDSFSTYHDVDPSPAGKYTVLYTGAEFMSASECPASINNGTAMYDVHSPETCTRNYVQRLNLSTGETTTVYSALLPKRHKIHDVDRINSTHYAVADIANNRVYVVDASDDQIEWQWRAEQSFSRDQGKQYPERWAHINDVEVLPDGRIMVSVRNMDQVVFIEPGEGIQENWTLGAENRYSVLYEAHNPDYIPKENGGPAVVVADSENNRIVEYERRNGQWVRTWTWTDASLQWPRDADRLPNGNTLVTDSNGNRVLEVAPNGSVVWSRVVGLPYEAERLRTGDESTGGPSATRANLESAGTTAAVVDALFDDEPGFGIGPLIKASVPPRVLSSALFVLPSWVGVVDLVPVTVVVTAVLLWAIAEFVWVAQCRLSSR